MVIINNTNYQSIISPFSGKVNDYITPATLFIKNNKLHRLYGPACIYSPSYKIWWVNDKFYGALNSNCSLYSQSQFLKDLSKFWLQSL